MATRSPSAKNNCCKSVNNFCYVTWPVSVIKHNHLNGINEYLIMSGHVRPTSVLVWHFVRSLLKFIMHTACDKCIIVVQFFVMCTVWVTDIFNFLSLECVDVISYVHWSLQVLHPRNENNDIKGGSLETEVDLCSPCFPLHTTSEASTYMYMYMYIHSFWNHLVVAPLNAYMYALMNVTTVHLFICYLYLW